MKTIKLLVLTVFMAAVVYGIPVNYLKVTNTGTRTVTGTGCIGTATLTAGCTLDAVGTINDARTTLTVRPSGSSATKAQTTSGVTGVNWVGANTTSRWLSPNNNGTNDPAGWYEYTQTFTLGPGASDREDFYLIGRFASDNASTLKLNGVGFANKGANTGNSWTPFSVYSGFVDGVNTLTYRVNNNSASTPSGIRVEFSKVNLPEGNEMMALSMMLSGLVLWSLKRRKANLVA